MGRRAVGGASAVGCGVFGLGGLLIGVALVVWLGSIALDGSNDAIGDGGTATTSTTALISPGGATLTLDPGTDLADGTEVQVSGAEFPPGSVRLVACLTHAPTGDRRCDDRTATVTAAGTDGAFAVRWTAPRVITVDGVAFDCAAAPGACTLRARPLGRPGDPGTGTVLLFASQLPPVGAEAPPTG